MIPTRLNTIRDEKDTKRLSELGYAFTEGDKTKNGTVYPTLAAAQMFLREHWGVIIISECVGYCSWRFRIIREDWKNDTISDPEVSRDNYVSHDYALLAGIKKALESKIKQ